MPLQLPVPVFYVQWDHSHCRGGSIPRIDTPTASTTFHRLQDSNASVYSSAVHWFSPSFPPTTVSPQIVQLFSALVSAYSFSHTPAPGSTQLHKTQNPVLLTVRSKVDVFNMALGEHITEAQSA